MERDTTTVQRKKKVVKGESLTTGHGWVDICSAVEGLIGVVITKERST
jgi:hypothetical protein